jgi:hypothetical protein
MKKCEKCQKELPEDYEFFYNKLRKDGKRFCSRNCHDEFYKKNNTCDKCLKNMKLDDVCYFNANRDDGKLFCTNHA